MSGATAHVMQCAVVQAPTRKRTGRCRPWRVLQRRDQLPDLQLFRGMGRRARFTAFQRQAHRRKTAPVLRAWPVGLQRGQMHRRAVALVLIEAVFRVPRVQFVHQPVAGHLGHDRGGHDGAVQRVAADQCLGRARQALGHAVAVDAREPGHMRHAFHRPPHAEHGRLVDIDAVDLFAVDQHHRPRQRPIDDARIQLLAPLGRELLGIVQPIDARFAGIEHHGRDGHRPGQWAAASFVDAGG
ncbi:hypothetical protein XAP6164_1270004 [Xanthomonas phaseoli pv. phaseoli]|nr:hypothetical protein XAP6164_1270004 [Xanthomonas phaseoli pv. phaseoli]